MLPVIFPHSNWGSISVLQIDQIRYLPIFDTNFSYYEELLWPHHLNSGLKNGKRESSIMSQRSMHRQVKNCIRYNKTIKCAGKNCVSYSVKSTSNFFFQIVTWAVSNGNENADAAHQYRHVCSVESFKLLLAHCFNRSGYSTRPIVRSKFSWIDADPGWCTRCIWVKVITAAALSVKLKAVVPLY